MTNIATLMLEWLQDLCYSPATFPGPHLNTLILGDVLL